MKYYNYLSCKDRSVRVNGRVGGAHVSCAIEIPMEGVACKP